MRCQREPADKAIYLCHAARARIREKSGDANLYVGSAKGDRIRLLSFHLVHVHAICFDFSLSSLRFAI